MKYMITDVKRLENVANNIRFLLNAYLNDDKCAAYNAMSLNCDVSTLLKEVSDILPDDYSNMIPRFEANEVSKFTTVLYYTIFLNRVINAAMEKILDDSTSSWDY